MKKTAQQQLGEMLQEAIFQPATKDMVDEYDELRDLMAEGHRISCAHILVQKIIGIACGKKSAQWAIDFIFDRLEGKAAPGVAPDKSGRDIEAKLDKITQGHLNELAESFAKGRDEPNTPEHSRAAGREEPEATEETPGSTKGFLDLPSHRPRGPEGDGG
jgi:hypothetical protein